jgi:putative membrane protein
VPDPATVFAVAALAVAYAAGAARWQRATGRPMVRRAAALSFAAGLLAVVVALSAPLDSWAETSLSAHMVQHVLLLSVAGPLLAMGAPLPALLWSLPAAGRRRTVAVSRRLLRNHDRHFPIWIAASLSGQMIVMWMWHLPDAYQAAMRNPWLHACEHAAFLLSSTVAWWSVVTGRRSRRGAAAVASLIGSVPGIMLGSAMVLAPNPWYPIYATGTRAAALSDQQVAGVVMWAFGGMAVVVAGAGLFASWLAGIGGPEPHAPVPPLPAAVGR